MHYPARTVPRLASPSLLWSADPIGFYHALHPQPVLLTLMAKLHDDRKVQLGSVTDPAAIAPTGVLTDPKYQAVWWTVCGQRPKRGKRPGQHATWPGWHRLTRGNGDTASNPVDTLSACWVDLDLKHDSHQRGPFRHDGKTDYGRFIPAMLALADAKGLPTPSVLLRSGQGLWFFWLLRNARGGPVRDGKSPDTALFGDMQRRLLACFPADLQDKNTSLRKQLMRIPGSVHPEGPVVEWARLSDATYTLAQLNAAIPDSEAPAVVRPTLAALPRARRQAVPVATTGGGHIPDPPAFDDLDALWGPATGPQQRNLKDIRSLYILARDRGGFPPTQRYQALLIALSALRLLYPEKSQAWRQRLAQINADLCRPPQKPSEVEDMVRSEESRHGQWSARTFAQAVAGDPTRRAPFRYAEIQHRLAIPDDVCQRLGIFVRKRSPKRPPGVRRDDARVLDGAIVRQWQAWGGPRAALATYHALRDDPAVRTSKGKSFTYERVNAASKIQRLFWDEHPHLRVALLGRREREKD